MGNRTQVTDALGQTTQTAYDALNRRVSETDPAGHTRYAYDAVGNLQQYTDRNGAVRTFAYDAANRQVAEAWLDSGLGIRTIQYAYDPAGNLTSARTRTARTASATTPPTA